ncbi:MAG TPA: LapA family protein [Acidimicrobiia bacterium]|nr:LapA family protein [Acidimicrobiia bacterium]HWW43775.1 LapA family protein [Acidimicrobiia bacterium]
MTAEHPAGSAAAEPRWRPSGRLVFAFVLVAIVLIFALVNLEDARIDFVFGEVTLPVFFVIAIPAFLGFGAGELVSHHRTKARRKRENR